MRNPSLSISSATSRQRRRTWKNSGQLSNVLIKTSLVDVNRLLAPCWTLAKALEAPLFTDEDEPFEL